MIEELRHSALGIDSAMTLPLFFVHEVVKIYGVKTALKTTWIAFYFVSFFANYSKRIQVLSNQACKVQRLKTTE